MVLPGQNVRSPGKPPCLKSPRAGLSAPSADRADSDIPPPLARPAARRAPTSRKLELRLVGQRGKIQPRARSTGMQAYRLPRANNGRGNMNKPMTATYSPDDDRMRIYARGTLSGPLCAMLEHQGFQLLPEAMVFVSSTGWSLRQEALLLQLCGTIEDDAVWHGDLYLPYIGHMPYRDLPPGTGPGTTRATGRCARRRWPAASIRKRRCCSHCGWRASPCCAVRSPACPPGWRTRKPARPRMVQPAPHPVSAETAAILLPSLPAGGPPGRLSAPPRPNRIRLRIAPIAPVTPFLFEEPGTMRCGWPDGQAWHQQASGLVKIPAWRV
ncbi:Uncharacterised protein [Chromobacterium violaceum]|uniref:Uncharacterized protein n=1 Tax=Chromobacterium violaceum TaxID=536 RepID=A0A3S4IJQ6_CHRVL|nr:Uncharacterised protein [Chromobacterium violaceum]